MAAIKKNLFIECGTDAVLLRFKMKDSTGQSINLAGCKARSQIRADYRSSTALVTFSTDDGSINFDSDVISMVVVPEKTNNITVTKGVWDFEFVDSQGKVSRVFEGKVTFSPQVSRVENA